VRDDLGVRLGLEIVPLALELVLQLEIVLDDAVMDDDDTARAVTMRVGILFGGPSVCGPPGVPYTVEPINWFALDRAFEVGELPR
jgi:hypothetical protein